MAYEQKEGDFSLFKNDKKVSGSNQPDYRGKAMINGVVYKLSGWAKGNAPSKFVAGRLEVDNYTPAQTAPEQAATVAPVTPEVEPVDEQQDLPF